MAAANALLMTFVVNGSITKYISTEATARSIFYSPQIVSPPRFELSGDGYISAGFGSFSIVNNPYDADAVFNYSEETYPATSKAYAVSFQWGEQAIPLFSGSAIIRKITDVEIEFDLIAPEYTQDLLQFTQNDTRVIVDTVADSLGGSGNPVRITATNHNIPDGSDVIFENMATATELDYNGTTATVYTISVVDTDTFDLVGTDSDDFTLGAEGTTGRVGVPEIRRMAFGNVTQRVPIIKDSTTVSNPHLDHTELIRVYEDGVNIAAGKSGGSSINVTAVTAASTTTYTVASHDFIVGDDLTPASFGDASYHVAQTVISITATTIVTDLNSTGFSTASPGNIDFTNVFGAAPTATNITLNGASSGGEISVSGTSAQAVTLSEFFTYVATELSLTLNTSKASGASSINLGFFVESQTKVIDLADRVAKNLNYQFYIENSIIYLIDKANDPTATEVTRPEWETSDVSYQFAVQSFQSSWTERVPFSGTDKRLGSKDRFQFVNNPNFAVGNVRTIPNFVESEVSQKVYLQALLDNYVKPMISLTKPILDDTTKPGDELSFDDDEKLLSCTLIVRNISYDFSMEKTVFIGDGSVAAITRDNIRQ